MQWICSLHYLDFSIDNPDDYLDFSIDNPDDYLDFSIDNPDGIDEGLAGGDGDG